MNKRDFLLQQQYLLEQQYLIEQAYIEEQKRIKKAMRRRIALIVVIAFLIIGIYLAATQGHNFKAVALKVNNGQPVVNAADIQCAPGESHKITFPISNQGALGLWYRIYLTNLEGDLQDYITISIKEEDGRILFSGKMRDLDRRGVVAGSLDSGEEKMLTMEFFFYPTVGMEVQTQTVSFEIKADAVIKFNIPFLNSDN